MIFDLLIQLSEYSPTWLLKQLPGYSSISILKSLMSPISLTLQKKTFFLQFNISFTILCLSADKCLKFNFGAQSKFSELRFFLLSYQAQEYAISLFYFLRVLLHIRYTLVFLSLISKAQILRYKFLRLHRVSFLFYSFEWLMNF